MENHRSVPMKGVTSIPSLYHTIKHGVQVSVKACENIPVRALEEGVVDEAFDALREAVFVIGAAHKDKDDLWSIFVQMVAILNKVETRQ